VVGRFKSGGKALSYKNGGLFLG